MIKTVQTSNGPRFEAETELHHARDFIHVWVPSLGHYQRDQYVRRETAEAAMRAIFAADAHQAWLLVQEMRVLLPAYEGADPAEQVDLAEIIGERGRKLADLVWSIVSEALTLTLDEGADTLGVDPHQIAEHSRAAFEQAKREDRAALPPEPAAKMTPKEGRAVIRTLKATTRKIEREIGASTKRKRRAK